MATDKTDKTDKTPAATLAASATSTLNEWGIPDWRNKIAYGDVCKWSDIRWRWEFTRRLDEFRGECDAILALHSEAEVAREAFRKTRIERHREEFGTLVRQLGDMQTKHMLNWGYLSNKPPLDPRFSDYPDDLLTVWPNIGITSMHGSPVGRAAKFRSRMTPEPNEIAVSINLDRPLAEQLKIVERVAKREQKERHGKLLQKRQHPALWLDYLRVLDAREIGATWKRITAVFFDQGLIERRKNASGGYCAPPPQAARDLWIAARDLRFNF